MYCLKSILLLSFIASCALADNLVSTFKDPPDSCRPGVYWYFMDGNLSREGMTRDLESMKAAGIGHVVFLEVNVGVPRGPESFLSERWQDLFVHAVREAERLGIEVTLGSGPGWTGSGGPWVKPEESMQHLVAAKVEVQGPARFEGVLSVAPPRRPFFGDIPPQLRSQWEGFFKDVAVLAFPTPAVENTIPDIDEKTLVYRAPFSSQPNVKPRLDRSADFPPDPANSVIDPDLLIDLTDRLKPDGTLDWVVPKGKWTVCRFVARNNGASTRPAPDPGIGFECDKFSATALDAHFQNYAGKLLQRVGKRQAGRGWTMLHIDSWEMGAQNWTPALRKEFKKRRGYDPQPFYPAFLGYVVGSRELSERFLWDLRQTGQELVIENHANRLKQLGRKYGLGLSIEPYDMTPLNDFDLGTVADVPMCEFWSAGFDTAFSCHTASSIAHVMGRPIVAAEAFTGGPEEAWRFYPGFLKNQGDWAFATGINRLTYHTFAHKPDESRPGMVMGPYGVHWDRGQTWWPMVGAYHRYISRCQHLLRQGHTVADVLYLMPEDAPNVFQPPPSAFNGSTSMPDRKGYNFDGCSSQTLIHHATVSAGRIVFPGGAAYHVLVLPRIELMTPELLRKLESLAKSGATIIGNPPRKSPSLEGYPACDREVAKRVDSIWGGTVPPDSLNTRTCGKGRIIWGKPLCGSVTSEPSAISNAKWIWLDKGDPARAAQVGSVSFRREFVLRPYKIKRARLEMTADNSFEARINGQVILRGQDFRKVHSVEVSDFIVAGANVLTVTAENSGTAENPAGLIGALEIEFSDGSKDVLITDQQWSVMPGAELESSLAKTLGDARMPPWSLEPQSVREPLYPDYEIAATTLRDRGVLEDFATSAPLRYTHRRTKERHIYFVASRSEKSVQASVRFRVPAGTPELWDPITGQTRSLSQFTSGETTEIPLAFEPWESYFIVFADRQNVEMKAQGNLRNFEELMEVKNLGGGWDVSFDASLGGPTQARFEVLEDWTQRPEAGIRYYSGIAVYRKSFDYNPAEGPRSGVFVDLGKLHVMARVWLNGKDCGVAWTAPWRVEVGRAIKAGENLLEIEIANLWPNRMIGDAGSSGPKFTQTTYRPYKSGDSLFPSGLLGPVRILEAKSPVQ